MMTLSLARVLAVVLAICVKGAMFAKADDLPEGVDAQEVYIQQYVDSKLQNGNPDFEALEVFARELATKAAQHQVYENALTTFYSQIGLVSLNPEAAGQIERWMHLYPKSATPKLAEITGRYLMALGDLQLALYSSWTWHEEPGARGVLESSRSLLLATKNYTAEDPYWYVLMAEITIALRRDISELDSLVEEGLKKHPANFALVSAATAGHLTKWQGSAESLEIFAQNVLALSPPSDGLANYARIYGVALRSQYGALLFNLAKPDWQKVMSGTRDLIARHPDEAHINQAAVLACVGGNRSLTREALEHPKFAHSDVHWYDIGTEYAPYEICRQWAQNTQPVEK